MPDSNALCATTTAITNQPHSPAASRPAAVTPAELRPHWYEPRFASTSASGGLARTTQQAPQPHAEATASTPRTRPSTRRVRRRDHTRKPEDTGPHQRARPTPPARAMRHQRQHESEQPRWQGHPQSRSLPRSTNHRTRKQDPHPKHEPPHPQARSPPKSTNHHTRKGADHPTQPPGSESYERRSRPVSRLRGRSACAAGASLDRANARLPGAANTPRGARQIKQSREQPRGARPSDTAH